MPYIKRITDSELKRKINASGAVLVRGAKAWGKTESAKQIAGSMLSVDRDSSDLEVDAIVQKYNGDWIACEIKLGTGQIEEAVAHLKKLVTVLDDTKVKPPKSLNIIAGTGVSYTRADGVNVISIASLGA